MNQQQLADQLAGHVARLVKLQNSLKANLKESKALRQSIQSEEEQIASFMRKLDIGECVSNGISVRVTNFRRLPQAPLKVLLPLIERIFSATPDKMESFVQEVKHFKQSNTLERQRVVCKLGQVDVTTTNKPRVVQTQTGGGAQSLASVLSSY